MSCRVKFHVVRSALQYSACRIIYVIKYLFLMSHESRVVKIVLRNRTALKKRTAKCSRVTNVTGPLRTYLQLTLMFSGLLQKDLFKGNWSLARSYFRQNYCHTCHTRFAVFFSLPSCCVSWLTVNHASRCKARSRITLLMVTSRITFYMIAYTAPLSSRWIKGIGGNLDLSWISQQSVSANDFCFL